MVQFAANFKHVSIADQLTPTEVIQSRIEKLNATLDDACGKVAPRIHLSLKLDARFSPVL